MNELQALLLGVVQGLTEFLPISSSGHLILVPWVLDFHYLEQHPDFNKTFDVALHSGTLVAVLAYFRHDLIALARGVRAQRAPAARRDDDERLGWLIVIATVPAAAIGAAGREHDRGQARASRGRSRSCWRCSASCWAWRTACRSGATIDGLGWRGALAIWASRRRWRSRPGTSRSGITITAGARPGPDPRARPRVSRSCCWRRSRSARCCTRGSTWRVTGPAAGQRRARSSWASWRPASRASRRSGGCCATSRPTTTTSSSGTG